MSVYTINQKIRILPTATKLSERLEIFSKQGSSIIDQEIRSITAGYITLFLVTGDYETTLTFTNLRVGKVILFNR